MNASGPGECLSCERAVASVVPHNAVGHLTVVTDRARVAEWEAARVLTDGLADTRLNIARRCRHAEHARTTATTTEG